MIIAITGYKQSGKSTASKYLQEKHEFVRHNFKDALIKELKTFFPDFIRKECELYNCTTEELFDRKPGHIRELMQNFGTELRRDEDPLYWIREWFLHRPDKDTVVDDCRFLNEAEAIKNIGGYVVRIIKIGQVKKDLHSSETEQDKITFDYLIEAEEGNHQKIYSELEAIINKIKKN